MKEAIENVLSEILSDKYECKVKLRFKAASKERNTYEEKK